MAIDEQMKRPRWSDRAPRDGAPGTRPRGLPAIGLEAEFATIVDGVLARPEDVFGSPRRIVRGPLVHRTGRSYHLPTGGAVYFDTGVIELATPMIEIERGCGARGTRSLWESLGFLREELDALGATDTTRDVRLVGFSTHYNVSFDIPRGEPREWSHGRAARVSADARARRARHAARRQPSLHRHRRAAARQPHRGHGGLHSGRRADGGDGDADRRHRARRDAVAELRRSPSWRVAAFPIVRGFRPVGAQLAEGVGRADMLLSRPIRSRAT